MKRNNVHSVSDDELMNQLGIVTKMTISRTLLLQLKDAGRAAMDALPRRAAPTTRQALLGRPARAISGSQAGDRPAGSRRRRGALSEPGGATMSLPHAAKAGVATRQFVADVPPDAPGSGRLDDRRRVVGAVGRRIRGSGRDGQRRSPAPCRAAAARRASAAAGAAAAGPRRRSARARTAAATAGEVEPLGVQLGQEAVGLAQRGSRGAPASGSGSRPGSASEHRRPRRRSRPRARGGRPGRAATASPTRSASAATSASGQRARRRAISARATASAPSGSRRVARAHSSRMRADQTGAKPPAAAAPSSISRITVGKSTQASSATLTAPSRRNSALR